MGGWGGTPNNALMPNAAEVDYVRVYQKEQSNPGITKTKYEAKDATLIKAGGNLRTEVGHENSMIIAGIDTSVGNAAEFSVNIEQAGDYNVDFRYYSDPGGTLSIYKDNAYVGKQNFPGIGNWTAGSTANGVYHFNSGANKFKIQYNSGDAPVNLDYIVVKP